MAPIWRCLPSCSPRSGNRTPKAPRTPKVNGLPMSLLRPAAEVCLWQMLTYVGVISGLFLLQGVFSSLFLF